MAVTILLVLLYVLAGIIGLLAALFILIAFISLFADRNKVYDKESRFFRFVLSYSTTIAAVLIRIRLKVTGMEKLPQGRFLLVSNHCSKFDPILTWLAFRKYHLAFISKPENFRVPIYGRIIRRCCFMAIDRENPREALKTINQAAKLLKNDEVSVAVYPEGTRNYGRGLLPFHNAVFKAAVKAGVPVVVMTVRGTEKIHKNYPFRRSVVRLDVLDVIGAEKVKAMKTSELGDISAKMMLEKLNEK